MLRSLLASLAVLSFCLGAVPSIVEFGPTFRDPLGDVAIADDGTVWATECNGAVHLKPDGTYTEFRRSDDGNPDCGMFGGPAILRGPDGAIWSSGQDRLLHYVHGGVAPVFPRFPGGIANGLGAMAANSSKLYVAAYQKRGVVAIGGDGSQSHLFPDMPVTTIATRGTTIWMGTAPRNPESTGARLTLVREGHSITGLARASLSCCAPFSLSIAPDGSLVGALTFNGNAWLGKTGIVRFSLSGAMSVLVPAVRSGGTAMELVGSTAIADDGTIWFSEPSANRIARVGDDGKLTEYRSGIPDGASPYGITLAKDGSVWFSDVTRNTVERWSPDGNVRVYGNGLSPLNTPGWPVVTKDGSLWFLETLEWHLRVARISPDGKVAEYPVARTEYGFNGSLQAMGNGVAWVGLSQTHNGRGITEFDADGTTREVDSRGCLMGYRNFACFKNRDGLGYLSRMSTDSVVLGPDGNLWFADVDHSAIGRMKRDGTVTLFTRGLTRFNSGPQYLTVGPDGALWFTEIRDRVGRITVDGHITEFSNGIPHRSFLGGIVAGRDGNLWFTMYHGNELVRITPRGAIRRFRQGIYPSRGNDSNCPDSMPFVDSLGRIWFNEPQGGRIARATLEP